MHSDNKVYVEFKYEFSAFSFLHLFFFPPSYIKPGKQLNRNSCAKQTPQDSYIQSSTPQETKRKDHTQW